jgi:hypothetical protein
VRTRACARIKRMVRNICIARFLARGDVTGDTDHRDF